MTRVCQITLICEDWRQSAFARGFLEKANVGNRVYETRNPGGSGHDWVKTKFFNEVQNLTRFAEGRGVLGLIDEDGQGVTTREHQVVTPLKELGISLGPDKGKCLLIPTRNIETWLYWLVGHKNGRSIQVDEITDYKNAPPRGEKIHNHDCRPAGQYLHSLNHVGLPTGCPSMLMQALDDLREFLKAVRR